MISLNMMGGVSGSGKTTFRKWIPAHFEFEPDTHYDEGDGLYRWTEDKKNAAWAACYRDFAVKLAEYRDRQSPYRGACFDAVFLRPAERLPVINMAKALGATVQMIFIDAPLSLCLERNATRTPDRRIPERVIASMYAGRSLPTMKEGFDQLRIIRPVKCDLDWKFHEVYWDLKEHRDTPRITDPRPAIVLARVPHEEAVGYGPCACRDTVVRDAFDEHRLNNRVHTREQCLKLPDPLEPLT